MSLHRKCCCGTHPPDCCCVWCCSGTPGYIDVDLSAITFQEAWGGTPFISFADPSFRAYVLVEVSGSMPDSIRVPCSGGCLWDNGSLDTLTLQPDLYLPVADSLTFTITVYDLPSVGDPDSPAVFVVEDVPVRSEIRRHEGKFALLVKPDIHFLPGTTGQTVHDCIIAAVPEAYGATGRDIVAGVIQDLILVSAGWVELIDTPPTPPYARRADSYDDWIDAPDSRSCLDEITVEGDDPPPDFTIEGIGTAPGRVDWMNGIQYPSYHYASGEAVLTPGPATAQTGCNEVGQGAAWCALTLHNTGEETSAGGSCPTDDNWTIDGNPMPIPDTMPALIISGGYDAPPSGSTEWGSIDCDAEGDSGLSGPGISPPYDIQYEFTVPADYNLATLYIPYVFGCYMQVTIYLNENVIDGGVRIGADGGSAFQAGELHDHLQHGTNTIRVEGYRDGAGNPDFGFLWEWGTPYFA